MFKNYLKIAFRNLLANKLFSIINIAGLASGMACCILIVFYAKDELSYDRFHKSIKRIYQLTCDRIEKDGSNEKFAIAAMVQGPAFQREIPELEQFVRVCPKQATVKKENESFIENITWADENFFSFFSFPLIKGNEKAALKDPHSVVLSEDAAKKYFNSADIIGKTIQVEINGNFEPFVITAVAKQTPENSSIRFNAILPFKYLEETNPDNGWMWVSYPTYFLVKKDADISAIDSKMEKVYASQAHEEIDMNHEAGYDNKFIWSLLPFEKMHLNTDYKGSFEASDPLYYRILISIAFFILLIATTNFINLTIANSLKRYKEIGVRKAIGSQRKQLAMQFLCESFLFTFLSFLLGIFLSWIFLPAFNQLANKKISFFYHFDIALICIMLLLFLLAGFLSGFYPALVLSSIKPVLALHGNGKNTNKNFLMKAFVVAQFSLTSFFVIVVWMMNVQFDFLTKADLGYNDKNLLEFTVEKAIMNKPMMEVFKSEFASVPGVQSAGYCNVGKFGGKTIANQKQIDAVYQRIDEAYLNTIQAHISAGRFFSKNFPTDSVNAVLINETFAKEAGWTDAVDKTIDYMNIPGWGDKKIFIVGVVKDYHMESLKQKIKSTVFTMDNRLPMGKYVLRLNPYNVQQTLTRIEKKYQSLIPSHPMEYAFKDDINRLAYEKENRWKSIITFSAGLAIFISCIGLFGVSLLITKRRAKEIAIRKVLGASTTSILSLICKDFIRLVLVGFLIAVPLSFSAIQKWLENFAYRADISWQVFVGAGAAIIIIAIATIIFHSTKASLANPAISLKQE
ncbi:MAG: ABC transporter permease [Bacteroidetes bacterium]|nr:ABC transporter permease [Bacteroidota bacterium]